MKTIILILSIVFTVHTPSIALTIIRDFTEGDQPTNSTGSGNLPDIFNAACDVWELAIRDEHVLTLHYCWVPYGGGFHTLNAQGGDPNRETEGTIEVNNDNVTGHHSYFLDPDPLENVGMTYSEKSIDLGGGDINYSRQFTWYDTDNKQDLYTIVLHEIGHALGLSKDNTSFQDEKGDGDIDITSPRPFASTTVPLRINNDGLDSNLGDVSGTCPLMGGSFVGGTRALPDVLSIVTLAQLSQFNELNLDLKPVLSISRPFVQDGTTKVRLSWIQPLGGTNAVQRCTDLHGTNWVTIDAPQSVTNGVHSVTVPMIGNAFFRLEK